ncbi:MAG: hypothetical protein ACC645_15005, partial [Pirellulales bacterium]
MRFIVSRRACCRLLAAALLVSFNLPHDRSIRAAGGHEPPATDSADDDVMLADLVIASDQPSQETPNDSLSTDRPADPLEDVPMQVKLHNGRSDSRRFVDGTAGVGDAHDAR